MVKAFLITLLLHLPFMLIIGVISDFLVRWSLRRLSSRNFIKIVWLLSLLVFTSGMFYGVLRFGGFVVFPEDNFNSYNWFDSSYRDDGFRYICYCGSVLAGIVKAFFFQNRKSSSIPEEEGKV